MVQLLNQGDGNTLSAIPLYQKGFNWIKYWLGLCFGCCLCLIFMSAITFIVLYILAQAGAIKSTRNGRMIPVDSSFDPITAVPRVDYPINHINHEKTSTQNLYKFKRYERKYYTDKLLRKKINLNSAA